ncbi:DUF2878 domain-containing protein [Marinimicrobium sp. ABcell2]|uniref:DUF2878 domain-containing protein n=1 Tax=Marinimicrobium sp. ABcell2 TaxID=3069751 RepID=UPI0027B560EA|nr:DUF2878 domain-containing protein [Marinimicrobium sp. ABcell2]MDQ2076797.1 DUF2878 domain-containing protein [Marinimicrobium sp. ABcell2]
MGCWLEHPAGNGIWFYLLWACAIVGRETWLPVTLALLLIHILVVEYPRRELASALPLAAIGVLLDSVLSYVGFFYFEGYLWAPPWLAALWLGFALCLHRSMRFFARHWVLSVGFGGMGGALSYWSGMKLGAVAFGLPEWLSVVLIASMWALLFPLLIALNRIFHASAPRRMP